MAITYQKARQLSDDITKQLAGKESEWRSFLRSSGTLYKYSFSDQLMIYAQRPDAAATASYETWNNVGRYVRRGSKGIALFKGNGDGLKYVFDVSDTDVSPYRKGQQVLPPWKMKKRHTQAVFDRLESEYGTTGTGLSYPDRLRGIVSAAVEDSFAELYERMEQEAGGSFLEDLDEANRKVLLHQAVSNSVSYMVFTRMGVDPELYLDEDDFSGLWNFNTPELLGVLGEAVNDLAGPLLREVEREIKRVDQENIKKPLEKETNREYTEFSDLKRENERGTEHGQQQPDIHHQGRLPISQPDDGRTGGGYREVREDAAQIPQGAQEGQAQRPAAGRKAESPPAGDKRENQNGDRQTGGGNAAHQSGTGEGNRSDGMGAAQEHADRQSGGNRDAGDHFQLSFFNTLPDIPSPEKQVRRIKETESKKLPVSFSSPEYVLNFRYVNDCLIVYNHANYDPDKLSPIVARVEPDGGIVILDENLPEKERLEIQRIAETELDRYKAEAEARTQEMVDAALAAVEQDTVGRETPQDGHPYAVGDTVYLENDKPYVIEGLDAGVELSDPSLPLPVWRRESVRDFERLLRDNAKNSRITDYLGADLELFNPDAEEVLSQGLLAPELRDALAGILDRGGSNGELADCLREHFGVYNAETMSLFDGSPADYFTDSRGLRIELEGYFPVKMSYSWEEIAPVVRSLHEQSRQREPAPEREQSPAQADSGIEPPDLTNGQREQPPSEYDYNAIPPLTLGAPPERTVEQPQPERAALTAARRAPSGNFRITDEHLGEGGQKTKYGYNVAAIRALKQIEGENRHAAPEEQEVLSRYVGWGGIPQAFDENNPKWTREYAELKELLTPAEYEAARRSTLNAHYARFVP